MGSKSAPAPSPPPTAPVDLSGFNMQLNNMQATIDQLSSSIANMQPPELPEAQTKVEKPNIPKPEIPEAPKPEEFMPEDTRKNAKGRNETILTSPLLEDEEAKTTKTTLG